MNEKKCKNAHHKYGKEQGGVGIWPPIFPPNTEIEGSFGGAGAYWRICTRCGKVKMHGIHPIV